MKDFFANVNGKYASSIISPLLGGGYETCTILERRGSPARTTLGFFDTPPKKVLDIECHI